MAVLKASAHDIHSLIPDISPCEELKDPLELLLKFVANTAADYDFSSGHRSSE